MTGSRIEITQPFLPPLEEFIPYLQQIWASKSLSNGGPFHMALEAALGRFLGVENISLVANGTLALLTALDALEISGEVITTPFSFIATAHALRWRGLTPVFADIDPVSLTLDPARVEEAITPLTSAILAVHVYGQPCDVGALQRIGDAHGLKVIYDAAHSFGVSDAGGSIVRHGDISALSFHATKVFSTLEGGAVVCRDRAMKQRVDRLRNFGLDGEDVIREAGINAKMNEIQAAFGLAQLGHMDAVIAKRGAVDRIYRAALGRLPGLRPFALAADVSQNHSYLPVLVEPDYGESRDDLYRRLRRNNVFARRYFYPLASNVPIYATLASAAPANLPQANLASERVLCLPLSHALTEEEIGRVIDLLAAPLS